MSLPQYSGPVFTEEDAYGVEHLFPILFGKKEIGTGCYSRAFEGTTPDTVLKLTVDQPYYDFIRLHGSGEGIPKLHKDWGTADDEVHGQLYLVEIQRLMPLKRWDHENLILERDAIIGSVGYRVAMSELIDDGLPCQTGHANALDEVRDTRMFSEPIAEALTSIGQYLRTSDHDLLLDLSNPDNFMTDGTRLYITDPFLMVM